MSILKELKRRNVFKVAFAYIIVAWLLLQVSDTLVPALHLPEWFHSGQELIREYDDSHSWCGPGLNSCTHWLNWKCGINLGAAREKVRVAHALKDLPKISEEFRRSKVLSLTNRAIITGSLADDFLLDGCSTLKTITAGPVIDQ